MQQQKQPAPEHSLNLKIKIMNGTVYNLSISSNQDSISQLANLVQDKIGVPLERQRLLYKGVLLSNGRLRDYGIQDGAVLQLVANMLPQQISSPSISTHRQSEVQRTQALTQQSQLLKKHRYLQQRINGFSLKSQQSAQTLCQNKKIIDNLLKSIPMLAKQNNSNGSSSGNNNAIKLSLKQKSLEQSRQPFKLEDRELDIGDWIDVRDGSGLWLEGQVVAKRGKFVQVHSNGYPDKWNQWVDRGSDRIMPFRTHTVQGDECPYLSPFPNNKPSIKDHQPSQKKLKNVLQSLPQTLINLSTLFCQLNDNPNIKKGEHKFSFNEEQQNQQYEQAESFKNNRSHNSPPPSIHEEEYEYDQYEEELEEEEEDYDQNGDRDRDRNKKQERDGGSIKEEKIGYPIPKTNAKGKVYAKFMRSNRYINAKKGYLGYSKTKSQHEHTLQHRQQTPNKNNTNAMMDQMLQQKQPQHERPQNSVVINSCHKHSEHNYTAENPQFQIDMQQASQLAVSPESRGAMDATYSNDPTYSLYPLDPSYPNQQSQPLPSSETYISSSVGIGVNASKMMADNMSNKCQQNMSNKGDHDDGESSAKSFGSKRSERFLDASSMKSLNIQTLGNNDKQIKKQEKKLHGKKNYYVFDSSEVQSVKNQSQTQNPQRPPNLMSNEGILEEEDSQINQQINQQYYSEKKKQYKKKIRATQLAPLCDRLGRLLIDLAPHLAMMGFRECNQSLQFCQNLSTFTNEGSLQSRFRIFNNEGQIEEEEQKSSLNSNRYYNFQVPVMLTPFEIAKINKLLAEENRETE